MSQYLLDQARQRTIDGRWEPLVEECLDDGPSEAIQPSSAQLALQFDRNLPRQLALLTSGPLDASRRAASRMRELVKVCAAVQAVPAEPKAGALILKSGASNRGGKIRQYGPRSTKKCRTRHRRLRCENGHYSNVLYGCCSRRCLQRACKGKHGSARARRARAPLEAFDGPRLCATGCAVLGFVPEARARLRDSRVWRATVRAADALVELWWLGVQGQKLQGSGWRLGLLEVAHPEGDENPTEWTELPGFAEGTPGEFKPHFNYLWPQVAFRRGKAKSLRFHIHDREFAKPLRQLWGFIQAIIIGAPLAKQADVWYGHRASAQKRRHAARYFFRTFPAWDVPLQRARRAGFLAPNFKGRPPQLDDFEKKAEEDIQALDNHRTCNVDGCSALVHIDQRGVPDEYRRVDQYLRPGTGPP